MKNSTQRWGCSLGLLVHGSSWARACCVQKFAVMQHLGRHLDYNTYMPMVRKFCSLCRRGHSCNHRGVCLVGPRAKGAKRNRNKLALPRSKEKIAAPAGSTPHPHPEDNSRIRLPPAEPMHCTPSLYTIRDSRVPFTCRCTYAGTTLLLPSARLCTPSGSSLTRRLGMVQ